MTYWSRDGLRQISVEEFAADKESRTLARTYLPDGGYVSTVWLGFDNGSGGAPLIYESMKFPEQDDCERYSTPAQALAGHSAMVLKHALKGWTETRAVLEDLMHEKRPGETWVLKLMGLRTELADLLVKAVDRRFGECLQCHSDTCSPGCLRFKILSELDPAWLRAQIIRANFDAITEDRRRFPVQRTLKVGDRVRFHFSSDRAALFVADEQSDFRATPFVTFRMIDDVSVRIDMPGHVARARRLGTRLLEPVYVVENVQMVARMVALNDAAPGQIVEVDIGADSPEAEAPGFDANGGK